MQDLTCRDMRNGDEDAVSQLIRNSFLRFIARDYKPEGLEIFLQETSAEGIAFKIREWPLLMVAEGCKDSGEAGIVGVIVLRRANHISLFFVDEDWHGKGVGRLLFHKAIQRIRKINPEIQSITVNSSPYGIGFYEKMGFRPSGPEQYMKGMLVNPMVFQL